MRAVEIHASIFAVSDITRILEALALGDLASADELLPLVCHDLRDLAIEPLGTDTLAHGAGAGSLVSARGKWPAAPWDNRAHFFTAAGRGYATDSGGSAPGGRIRGL